MDLIVITPDNLIRDEAALANRMFENGLQRLHVRKPSFSVEEMESYIQAIDTAFHSRLVLCDHFQLISGHDIAGVHLNSHMRSDTALAATIMHLPASSISTSFHSWQEVLDNGVPYGYVLISPVFDSISKSGYKAAIELTQAVEVKKQLSQTSRPSRIVGLGGVGHAELEILATHGFDGAAMLGSIWLSEDPVASFVVARDIAAVI